MSPISCPFCEELSAPGAKFCSACGGALHLAPCPRCGAVNDVSAATCYQCRGQLTGGKAEVPEAVVPAAEPARRRRYGFPQMSITVAILAAIGALAYYGLAQRVPVDAPPPVSAAGEASDRAVPANAGVIRRDATATEASAINPDASAHATIEPPASSPPKPTKVRAAASPSRAERRALESPKQRAASIATTGPQASTAGKAREGGAPSPVACTEQVAALGLCPPESVQMKQAETATPGKTPIASPRAAGGGKPPGQERTHGETCTEAVAALGLCAPESTQRRE
jgi:hypothetical protein